MPSVVVHVAIAGLLGTALLGDRFDTGAIAVVLFATASIDSDTLIGLAVPGAHRTVFHNVWIVLVPAAFLWWDARYRDGSVVRDRVGEDGYRVVWVTLVTVLFAHILLDAFYNGVNLFWPLHDRFLDLSGKLLVSDRRGIVQTFVELDGTGRTMAESTTRGTTEDTHYATGFNPAPGELSDDAERTFPIAATGERLVLVVASAVTVGFRILETRRSAEGSE